MLQLARTAERDAQPNSQEPSIGDYAIIGDCRTAALVSRDGSIDWLCLPHYSGASVFAALLDQACGGRFRIRPTAPFRSTRRYLGATGVLETAFETASGSARLLDLMPVAGNLSTLQPLREVIRIVEGIEGEVTLEVRWEPRPRYASADAKVRSRGAIGWSCDSSDELFLLRSEAPLDLVPDEKAVVGRIRVQAGQRVRLSLC